MIDAMPTDILNIPKTPGPGPTMVTKMPESIIDSCLRCTIFGWAKKSG
jgi:hypothetical protein